MKKFQFLLLDAGPIIKFFELNLWEAFVEKCDVTITRTIINEAKWASQGYEDVCIDLQSYEKNGHLNIIDLEPFLVKQFYDKFDFSYQAIIHSGEKETLAFLDNTSDEFILCTADGSVFKVLGLLGKSEQGVSLEEILKEIGLPQNKLEWQYTKRFREKYTRMGQADSIQGKGLV